jgi:hypothetical protein
LGHTIQRHRIFQGSSEKDLPLVAERVIDLTADDGVSRIVALRGVVYRDNGVATHVDQVVARYEVAFDVRVSGADYDESAPAGRLGNGLD